MERDLGVPARLLSSRAGPLTILSSPITPAMSILYPEIYLPIYLRDRLGWLGSYRDVWFFIREGGREGRDHSTGGQVWLVDTT